MQVGQPIMARAIGGNADYALAQSQNVFPCPVGLDMQQAGGIPIVFLTAYHLLRSLKPLQPGDTVLVQAAASGVGTVLIQLLNLLIAHSFCAYQRGLGCVSGGTQ